MSIIRFTTGMVERGDLIITIYYAIVYTESSYSMASFT